MIRNLMNKTFLAAAIFAVAACGTAFAGETLTFDGVAYSGPGMTVGGWEVMSAIGSNNGTAAAPDLLLTFQAMWLGGSVNNPLIAQFTADTMTATPLSAFEADSEILHDTSVTDKTFYSSANATPATTLIPALNYAQVGIPSIMSYSNGISPTVVISPLTPYSITLQAVVDYNGVASVGGPASAQVTEQLFGSKVTTPEPSFYALMGVGVVGLLALAARRRNASQAV